MVGLDSQDVRNLFSNLPTRFLTMAWWIWTLRMCVIPLKCTDPVSDRDTVDLDSQWVRDLLSNLLTDL